MIPRIPPAWQPVVVYAAAHGALLAALSAVLLRASQNPFTALGRWDGVWYQRISRSGYETHLLYTAPGKPQEMRIAFFPLYPYLMKALAFPLGGSTPAAGVVISALAGLAAAVGIFRLLGEYLSARTALLVVALWATVPPAFVESMVYTESLFTAFAVFALYALLKRRWLTAGALTAAAGLSRSTVVLLIAVVAVAAGIAIARRRDGWRPYAAVALTPLGIVGYWVFLAVRLHRVNAWFVSQEAHGWRSSIDLGHQSAKILLQQFTFSTFGSTYWLVLMLTTAMLVPALVSAPILGWNRAVPWELRAWTLATVAFTLLSSGAYDSKPRFLLPCFPLLVPGALVLAKARPRTAVLVVTVTALVGAWFGAYFLNWSNLAP